MDWSGVYECPLCEARSPVRVTGLEDPKTFIRARAEETLHGLNEAKQRLGLATDADPSESLARELLETIAKNELAYAVCPRCARRNPAGESAQATEARRARAIGVSACSAAALAVWLAPAAAYVVAGVAVVVTLALAVAAVRAKVARARRAPLVSSVLFSALLVAAAWLYPRATIVFPVVLGLRFALPVRDDSRWARAKERLVFETPYR